MSETTTVDLRLVVSVEETNIGTPCLRFRASVTYLASDGSMRNPVWQSYSDHRSLDALDAFEVSAQRDLDSGEWYGFSIDYREPYRVDVARADAMSKTLHKVQRSLDRQAGTYGYAVDLVAYVARVAQALKVDGYVRRADGGSNDYVTGEWRHMDADALRWWLDESVKTWQARHNIEAIGT